jgi:hypothetical protein
MDYLVIFNERHLRRVFTSYLDYYHRRTHHSLDKDCPEQQPIQVPKSGLMQLSRIDDQSHAPKQRRAEQYARGPISNGSPYARKSHPVKGDLRRSSRSLRPRI